MIAKQPTTNKLRLALLVSIACVALLNNGVSVHGFPSTCFSANRSTRNGILVSVGGSASSEPFSSIERYSIRAIDLSYEITMQALRSYHAKYLTLALPRKYVVPDDDDFPREWYGRDLAATVYDMRWWQRHVKERPERVAELNQLGFVWERLQPEWNLIVEALINFRDINKHLLVPANFVVPYGEEAWPRGAWGLPLGNAVHRIRNRGDFVRGSDTWKSRQDQLDALGFVWDVPERKFKIFYYALRHYATLQSRESGFKPSRYLRVPSTFVVPKSNDWPAELWGYKLGSKCIAIRQKGLYVKGKPERMEMLHGLGFQEQGNASLGWHKVIHAAALYSQMNNRTLNVPFKFVVPAPPQYIHASESSVEPKQDDDAWPWPEDLWGFPLGQRLKDIRVKNAYLRGKDGLARKARLDGLGFVWKPKRGKAERQT